jgi:bla regulator protein BlaR1
MHRSCTALLASLFVVSAWAQVAGPNEPAALPQSAASAAAAERAIKARKFAESPLGACFREPPAYPRTALRNEQEGRTVLAFTVLESGEVGPASLVRSSGHTALDDAALAHLGKCIAAAPSPPGDSMPAGRYVLPMLWRIE